LRFTDILRRSFADYRANLILVVPWLILFVVDGVTAVFSSAYLTPRFTGSSNSKLSSVSFHSLALFYLTYLPVELLWLVATYVILLGRVVMTSRVIMDHKTTIADWPDGVRRYFWRVFGVSLVFTILLAIPRYVAEPVYNALKWAGLNAAYFAYGSVVDTLRAPIVLAFYICLGAVSLDGRSFAEALRFGSKVLSYRRSAFAWLVVLLVVYGLFFEALDYPIYLYLKNGSLAYFGYVIGLVQDVIAPIWMLMAFRIYRGLENLDSTLTAAQQQAAR
jgi:hypothetical protein